MTDQPARPVGANHDRRDGPIRPFRIDVSPSDLDDLNRRLARARWPDGLPGLGWKRGVPLDYLKGLAEYWRATYDWREQEYKLNQFPQFTTEIDGQTIHFLHLRSPEPDALPLIITHGWPGSIVEFMQILGALADPRAHGGNPADAFHVVAPSLPGFGYSIPGNGWGVARTARCWAELMRRLGYRRYGVQGGDIGSAVSGMLGSNAPEQVVGVHLNTDLLAAAAVLTFATGQPTDPATLPAMDEVSRERFHRFQLEGLAYLKIQATRPLTLGYGLTDSPIGQLAWIVEKFQEWTNSAAELPEDAVDRDQLLTNVSLYWFTRTAVSSARFGDADTEGDWAGPSSVPEGWAVFGGGGDVVRQLLDPEHRIQHWSAFDRGGHFAAMEAPDLLIDDVRAFFRLL